MPIYTVEHNGKVFDIEGPAGATPAQLQAAIGSQSAPTAAPAPKSALPKSNYGLTEDPGVIQQFLGGAKHAWDRAAAGLEDLVPGGKRLSEKLGQPDMQQLVKQGSQFVKETGPASTVGNIAGEIALTNDITNFLVQPGDQSTGAMAIYTDSDTFILYGTSSANWNLVSYNVGTGAKPYTAQNMAQSYVFDDRGIINLQTTLNYGNFDSAALTLNIRPFIQQRRNLATGSSLNREKAQYRVFFSDSYALYTTISNNQMMGAMPVQFPNPVTVVTEGETPDGAETSFFGSTNGFVYRLDAGTSFDGAEISANVTLVFNAIKSPRILKRYRKGSMEITGTSYAEFTFSYDLGYSSTDIGQDIGGQYSSNLISSYWDSVSWDAFVWDGRTLAPSEVEIKGTAENIAVRIASISDIYAQFTINSTILHYSMRRGLR